MVLKLIILIQNPFNLFDTGFLLTYGGTIGIIYFRKIIEKILKSLKIRNKKIKHKDPFDRALIAQAKENKMI